ncbi:MAG: phospholipase [Alicyclobacillus sp.]|nr:phospholipase [Alicyclobacillus sp.]
MFSYRPVRKWMALLLIGVVCVPAAQTMLQAVPNAAARTVDTQSVSWIPEPGSGARPWIDLIEHAKRQIDVNNYLLTDRQVAQALIAAAKRGVNVRVIADEHPYRDAKAVAQERAEFARTKVQLRFWSPSANSFDHAKYMVIDGNKAIVGSANADYSAMEGGRNQEGDVEVSGGPVPGELESIFTADWAGKPATVPNGPLVVAPGAEAAMVSLLKQPGPLSVASEELGSDKALLAAMESKGSQLRLLLPSSLSSSDLNNARTLAEHGVQVRLLKSPYVHAKVVLSDSQVFVGSENLTSTSLNDNREVGIIVKDQTVLRQASGWFETYWAKATPLGKTQAGQSATSRSSGQSYPYLPLGLSESEVRARWGNPSSVGHTTYHGQPETVWRYPNGAVCYFDAHGRLVHVSR